MDFKSQIYNLTINTTFVDDKENDEGQAHLCGAIRSYEYLDYTQQRPVWWTFVLLYIAVMTFSLLGNLMVVWNICRHKYMRTVTNYYILNLAVCDILISAFVIPLKLTEYTGTCSWQLVNVDALCSALFYVLPVFVFASVFTLVAISIERYHAIVHPLRSRKIHSQSRTIRILIFTWLAAIIVPTPYLYCKSYPFSITSDLGVISRRICTDRFDEIDEFFYGPGAQDSGSFRRGYFAFLFMAIYVIPVIIIVCTCSKISIALLKPWQGSPQLNTENRVTRRQEENKRKVARMIIFISLTFIVSWTPFYLVTLISQVQRNSFLRQSNFLFTMLTIHLCGFLNSASNPIIYYIMSDRFHRGFNEIWKHLFCICCRGLKVLRKNRRFSRSEASQRMWSEADVQNGDGICLSRLTPSNSNQKMMNTKVTYSALLLKRESRTSGSVTAL